MNLVAEARRAREVLAPLLAPTPFLEYPVLSRRLGCEAWIKLENVQPVGAFKVRGGLYLLSRMKPSERGRGLVSATRGNHGQSLAYASRRYGARCTLYVPRGNNPDKVAAMRALAARVVVAGADFDEAWDAARVHAARTGERLVDPGNEPELLGGVATMALEMLSQGPPLDAVFVPAGLGTCLAATAGIFKALSPGTRVIGVQASGAPAFTRAWRSGRPCTTRTAATVADGLACRRPPERTLALARQSVDAMVLVAEREILRAMRWYLETAHHLAEGAGAAALAGAVRMRRELAGRRIGIVLSGGNVDRTGLAAMMAGRCSPSISPPSRSASYGPSGFSPGARSAPPTAPGWHLLPSPSWAS